MSDKPELHINLPEGVFNDLEIGIARQMAIEFLHLLKGIRRPNPAHNIDGGGVDIKFAKQNVGVDYHADTRNRPKRIRWQVSIELDNYQPAQAEAQGEEMRATDA